MPFPGWSEFEGPDSADLDGAAKQGIASAAIPVPEGVTRGVIRLADERRYDVPVVLICPEFPRPRPGSGSTRAGSPSWRRASTCRFSTSSPDTGP